MSGETGATMIAPGERVGDYCRAIEAHLCRRNGGHLVRIVGPVFQTVCGWYAEGMPLKVVLQGIDRTVDREHGKGPQLRPVRVEFCAADVRDAFDAWRRAVGVHARAAGMADDEDRSRSEAPDGATSATAPMPRTRPPALQGHVDRAMSRLTQCRLDVRGTAALEAAIDAALSALDEMRRAAKGLRGDARDRFVGRLRAIDEALVIAAEAALDSRARADLDREARQEIDPFTGRMPAAALAQARDAARARLVREHWRLPDLTAGL